MSDMDEVMGGAAAPNMIPALMARSFKAFRGEPAVIDEAVEVLTSAAALVASPAGCSRQA